MDSRSELPFFWDLGCEHLVGRKREEGAFHLRMMDHGIVMKSRRGTTRVSAPHRSAAQPQAVKYDIEVRKLQTYHPARLTFSDLQKNAAMRILQSFGSYGLQQGDEAAAKRPIKMVREGGGRSRCRRCYPIPSERTETDADGRRGGS